MMKVRAKFIVVVVIGFVAVQASVIGSSVRKLETELDLLNYNEDAIFTPVSKTHFIKNSFKEFHTFRGQNI